jgi:hypothetical protein
MPTPTLADQPKMARRTSVLAVALLALLLFTAPSAGAAAPRLWATVNACDVPAKPSAIGIRASMPPSKSGLPQWIRFRVEFWSDQAQAWKTVTAKSADSGWDRVGSGKRKVRTGVTFSFTPPQAGARFLLRGRVDYQWRRGSKVVVRETRRTSDGHAVPDDPQLAVSQATCEIKR